MFKAFASTLMKYPHMMRMCVHTTGARALTTYIEYAFLCVGGYSGSKADMKKDKGTTELGHNYSKGMRTIFTEMGMND